MTTESRYSHYYKDVSGLSHIDVYRVLLLFGVSDPCVQHAIKKLLCAGLRGGKDQSVDVEEAIATLQRWQAMRAEDLGKAKGEPQAAGHIGSTLDVERMARTGEVAEPPEPRPIINDDDYESLTSPLSIEDPPNDDLVGCANSDCRKAQIHRGPCEPEPRPIVVGSTWSVDGYLLEVADIAYPLVRVRTPRHNQLEPWNADVFRRICTWLSDPPATPAPELPHKVEPGTKLTVGARYRITAISTDDSCPANRVGDVVTGYDDDRAMPVGTVLLNWDGDGYWFAKGGGPSAGTYVTGLELVAEAP